MDEVRHTAKIAQIDELIDNLEDGYDTPVSQGGNNFSGGQKQRLSIARAFVKKPEIYVFDDSFSALDFKTDAKLRAALKSEIENAAVILVAQRISTIMDADRIVVLDAGKSPELAHIKSSWHPALFTSRLPTLSSVRRNWHEYRKRYPRKHHQ